MLQPLMSFLHRTFVSRTLICEFIDRLTVLARLDSVLVQQPLFDRHCAIMLLRHLTILAFDLKLHRRWQYRDFDCADSPEADCHGVHAVHDSLYLQCAETRFQKAANVKWVDTIDSDSVDVLADV